MCLAQGHNAVTPVRLKPADPRSLVKHSTTEPLLSSRGNLSMESQSQNSEVRKNPENVHQCKQTRVNHS